MKVSFHTLHFSRTPPKSLVSITTCISVSNYLNTWITNTFQHFGFDHTRLWAWEITSKTTTIIGNMTWKFLKICNLCSRWIMGFQFFCQVEQSQQINKFHTFKGLFGFYSQGMYELIKCILLKRNISTPKVFFFMDSLTIIYYYYYFLQPSILDAL